MKLSYTKVERPDAAAPLYRPAGYPDPCCQGMSEGIKTAVVFHEDDDGLTYVPALCIYSGDQDGFGDTEKSYHRITFCPFCGEKIEAVQTGRVRQTLVETEEVVSRLERREEVVE